MKTYYEVILYTEDGSEYSGIVDTDGVEVPDYKGFEEGDKLVLLHMPYDLDGRHATGEAVFEGIRDRDGYPQWRNIYEGD